MKKMMLGLILFFCMDYYAYAIKPATLMEVYQQAIVSDPTFQQSIAQTLATKQAVPISLSSLLPSLGVTYNPFIERITGSGPTATVQGNDHQRGYNVVLTATQTVFNLADYYNLKQSKSLAKQAIAQLNSSAQDLMIRVAAAYFQVLEDVDVLRASGSAKVAFSKQLDQVTQQYKVGIKTLTDVYTSQASYEGSVADYIASETKLENDKENLRAITGVLYPQLASLSEKFPLISPRPDKIDAWLATALAQNWQIKSNQYAVDAARQNIKQQFAGHMPTLNVQGQYEINYLHDLDGNTTLAPNTSPDTLSPSLINQIFNPPGAGQMHTTSIALNLSVPILQGGLVVAETHQAQYNFEAAIQQLEFQIRQTMNVTRQSYLNIIAGISKIKADVETIKSAKSSLSGMEAGYRVGTEILVNVLNQQQQVLTDEKIYAHDRYAYVNNLLALKEASGTLAPEDLLAINAWLIGETNQVYKN